MLNVNRIARLVCGATLVGLGVALPARARAQTVPVNDSAAVIAVVQRLFDAMASRDTAAARSLLLPGSRVISIRPGSAGVAPRVQTDSAFIRSLAVSREALLERMWNPIVRVHGPLAEVWTPYDFHRDGRFSHCGVDSIALMRGQNGWQIVSIAYTVEPTGCAPSPLGPPKPGRIDAPPPLKQQW